MPVMTIGAYNVPKIAPPTKPKVSYNQVNPALINEPASRPNGPITVNAKKPAINNEHSGVTRLSK